MSMTEQGVAVKTVNAGQSGLAQAVAEFNRIFDYGVRLPIRRQDLAAIVELAELRGRTDVSRRLRNFLAA